MTTCGVIPDVFEPVAAATSLVTASLLPPERPDAKLGVLDVSEYYGKDSGGVRTYLHEKARYVATHPALRQVIVVPDERASVRSADGVRVYRMHGGRIPFQSTYRVLANASEFRRIVARERPDIIEIGSAYGAPWVASRAARRLDIPLVWYFHAHLPRILAPELGQSPPARRVAAGLAAGYVRAIARRVDLVLVASESVKADLEAFHVTNVEVASLGVDTEIFHSLRRTRRGETLARLQLPDVPITLYTGRFTREKELSAAVRAWNLVRTPGAVLVLAGAGPQEATLRQAVGTRVRLLPFEHDRGRLADLCAAADLYLAPGPAETFGLSAHEALACGTPVLSVNRGAVAEAVRRSGCGGTWAHGNGAEMAAMVDTLLAQDGEGRAAARDHVLRHHRWGGVFDRLFSIYARLATAGRA